MPIKGTCSNLRKASYFASLLSNYTSCTTSQGSIEPFALSTTLSTLLIPMSRFKPMSVASSL